MAKIRSKGVQRAAWLALLGAVMTVGLSIYGSWVRTSGSGLGCPDWPLCQGTVLPELQRATAIEFGHRVYAGLTMVVVALAAGMTNLRMVRVGGLPLPAWRGDKEDPTLARLLLAAVGVIILQAGLGGATVLTELHGMVRLAHLSMAMITLALLTVAAVRGLRVPYTPSPSWGVATGLVALTALVMLVGGFIVGSGVSAGCLGLPLCDSRSTPADAGIHLFHRGTTVILVVALLAVAIRLRRGGATPLAKAFGHGAAALVVAQALVGILAVANLLPLGLRVLHVALATGLWWAVVAQWAIAFRAKGES